MKGLLGKLALGVVAAGLMINSVPDIYASKGTNKFKIPRARSLEQIGLSGNGLKNEKPEVTIRSYGEKGSKLSFKRWDDKNGDGVQDKGEFYDVKGGNGEVTLYRDDKILFSYDSEGMLGRHVHFHFHKLFDEAEDTKIVGSCMLHGESKTVEKEDVKSGKVKLPTFNIDWWKGQLLRHPGYRESSFSGTQSYMMMITDCDNKPNEGFMFDINWDKDRPKKK